MEKAGNIIKKQDVQRMEFFKKKTEIKRAMNVEFSQNLRGKIRIPKKYYEKLRFFLNNSICICDNMNRKPAKPLSSDTLNLVGVSFLGKFANAL